MKYRLNNNVYLVRGKVRSCIYNLNNSKLYSINSALANKIEIANLEGIDEDSLDDELKTLFDNFVEEGILDLTETMSPHEIKEIASPDYGCVFAWIEITNRCNLKCLHCYNESDVHCDSIMSFENYKRVVDNLVAFGVKKVQIIGGEPLVEKKLLRRMLEYTVEKFSFIEIFTNGTLITPEWVEFFAQNNIHIALSVYSYKKEEHDRVTGVIGSWERTNKTIYELKNRNVSYRVCNVLMKGISLGEKSTDLYELSCEKDVVRMSGRANFSLLSDELIRKKLITKEKFRSPIKRNFCSMLLSGHNCFNNKIYVSADMKVYPCVMERRLVHCDISDGSQIVLDETIRKFNKDQIKECCECEYRYACHDCRPNSLSEEITEKPWFCTYIPGQGEWQDVDNFIKELKEKWSD